MTPDSRRSTRTQTAVLRVLMGLLAGAICLAATGCAVFPKRRAAGGPVVTLRETELQANVISNLFIVSAKQDDGKVHRFLVDTGSSATLVSPAFAGELGSPDQSGANRGKVRVRGAHGTETELDSAIIRKFWIGDTLYERAPVLVYDFTELSQHLGVEITGVIGFPMFRDMLVTLDYPGGRLRLSPRSANVAQGMNSSTIPYNSDRGTPLIPVQLGNESFVVLIDTGSDGSLTLNPAGLHPRFAHGPRPGTVVTSLAGDRRQLVGRLGQNLLIGSHVIERPIVDVSTELSSLGGELLRHFSLTFDQSRRQVTFARIADAPVTMAPRRSTGLSFARSNAYWRVLAVVPDTPAAALPVQNGDLCVRINGEPVNAWDFERYAALVRSAGKITYTFLAGAREFDLEVSVFDLVP